MQQVEQFTAYFTERRGTGHHIIGDAVNLRVWDRLFWVNQGGLLRTLR